MTLILTVKTANIIITYQVINQLIIHFVFWNILEAKNVLNYILGIEKYSKSAAE